MEKAIDPYAETASAALVTIGGEKHSVSVRDAVITSPEDAEYLLVELEADDRACSKALKILEQGKRGAYERALDALETDTRILWEQELSKEPDLPREDYTECLAAFFKQEVMSMNAEQRRDIEKHPALRKQAFGEAFNIEKLERLARYEVHLDRKLERILSMLLKMQELRREKEAA